MVSPGVGDEVHCFEVDGELADDRVMKALHTSVVSVDVVSRPQGSGAGRMEPLWGPVVATGGNRSQNGEAQKLRKQAKTFAVGCDRLPQRAHGKEGVDGSSPSEGSENFLLIGPFS